MKSKVKLLIVILLFLLVGFFFIRIPIANQYKIKGEILFDSNSFNEAAERLSKSVSWYTKDYKALVLLTKCWLILEKAEEARVSFQNLQKHFPDSADTYAIHGQLLLIDKDFESALVALNNAIATNSSLAYAFFYRGIINANLGNLEEAAADYIKAQELDETDADILREGAKVFSRLNDFTAAIENYDKMIALDSTNSTAFHERASFKLKIADYKGALSDINRAITLASDINDFYYERGKILIHLENFEDAITDFKYSIDKNYKVSGSYFNMGLASLKKNDLKNAKRYLTQCVKSDKQNEHTAKALYLNGVIAMMGNQRMQAIEFFNQSISKDSTNANAFYNRGIAYGILEQYENAINDLQQCIRLKKNSADIYFALGVYKISLHQNKDGCSELSKAVKMGHEQAKVMQQKYCKQYLK